ncbi:peptidase inhibitor family I36 protein [Kitasatospora sp. NPDC096147]|uniref:peptidase inhibitor family I36 protein n=1 Tax=Kitasatospora sp. NPDC096147 TaxID=3364093 RepID=UPI003819C54E
MRAFRKAIIGLAGAAALTSGMTGTASAATGDGVCDSGEFCLYYGRDFTGHVFDTTASRSSYIGLSYPGTSIRLLDGVGSWWNRTDTRVEVFENSNYAGAGTLIAPGSRSVNTYRHSAASHWIG